MLAQTSTVGIVRGITTTILLFPIFVVSLYFVVASPPLHLVYDRIPHAGPNSVYVPGAGFAGFWYHLGLFHTLFDGIDGKVSSKEAFNPDTTFYCYSSGCLSIILSFLSQVRQNRSSCTTLDVVDNTYSSALQSQQAWLNGNISQYEIVGMFLKSTILDPIESNHVDEQELLRFLPRLNILVTTLIKGTHVGKATTVKELIALLRQTTWIPFVTGHGIGKSSYETYYHEHGYDERNASIHVSENDDWFLDGGFSRMIHPNCQYTVSVPINWQTTIHTLNPGMSYENVMEMWRLGLHDSETYLTRIKKPILDTQKTLNHIVVNELSYI